MTTQSPKSTLTLRMLIRRESSTWEVLPASRGLALFQGKTHESEWANQHIEVVFAHLRTDTTPHRLVSATRSVWQFDGRGRINRRHVMKEILRKLDAPPIQCSEEASSQVSESDLVEICALLRVLPSD